MFVGRGKSAYTFRWMMIEGKDKKYVVTKMENFLRVAVAEASYCGWKLGKKEKLQSS